MALIARRRQGSRPPLRNLARTASRTLFVQARQGAYEARAEAPITVAFATESESSEGIRA